MPELVDKPKKIGWLEAWHSRYLRYPSVIILIVANLVPLYGVIFWGWDLLTLMLVYWTETGVIGFWTILHMALVTKWLALFMVPFFVIHFGGFMLGHLMFIVAIFAGDIANLKSPDDFAQLFHTVMFEKGLWLALAALFISHGVSFFINVLRPWWRGEPEQQTDGNVMMAPYGRIVIMHVTLIIGAGLVAYFGTRTAAFVLLIALKIIVDVAAHIRKNFKPQAEPERGLSAA